jgi:hypothetical protein
MLRALAIAALLSCGSAPVGSTLCGMAVYGANTIEAEALQWAEFASMQAIRDVALLKSGAPMPEDKACEALRDVELYMVDDPWLSKTCDCQEPPMLCGSLTVYPIGGRMQLLRTAKQSQGCMTHEILHGAQLRIEGVADVKHEAWPKQQFFATIDDARARLLALGM